MVEKVLEAENNAGLASQQAHKKAADMLSAAEDEMSAMRQKRIAGVRAEIAELKKKSEERNAGVLASHEQQAKQQADELERNAAARLNDAIAAVVAAVIPD